MRRHSNVVRLPLRLAVAGAAHGFVTVTAHLCRSNSRLGPKSDSSRAESDGMAMGPEHRLCRPHHTLVAFELPMSWRNDTSEPTACRVGWDFYDAPTIAHRLGLVLNRPAAGSSRLLRGRNNLLHACNNSALRRWIWGPPGTRPVLVRAGCLRRRVRFVEFYAVPRQDCALVVEEATGAMLGCDSLVVFATGVGRGVGWLAGRSGCRAGAACGMRPARGAPGSLGGLTVEIGQPKRASSGPSRPDRPFDPARELG
jgi:hypothetical protein